MHSKMQENFDDEEKWTNSVKSKFAQLAESDKTALLEHLKACEQWLEYSDETKRLAECLEGLLGYVELQCRGLETIQKHKLYVYTTSFLTTMGYKTTVNVQNIYPLEFLFWRIAWIDGVLTVKPLSTSGGDKLILDLKVLL